MSNQDYVELKAALGAIENVEFQCHKCLAKYDGRKDKETMLQKARDNKGCFSEKPQVIHKIDDLGFRSCVGNFVGPGSYFVVELHGRFQKGIMPFAGSYVDQPNKLIEAFGVLDGWSADKLKEAERKRNVKNGIGKGRAGNNRQV